MAILKSKSKRGKLIAIYGPNNIGKSTQVEILAGKMISEKYKTFLILKYPIYTLEPTGPRLNSILREGNPENLSPLMIQKIFAENRFDFQNTLIEILNSGLNVVLEDYVGTGISWGLVDGVKLRDLENINYGLITPDLSILMDGERFISGAENGHHNESSDTTRWELSRKTHLRLGKKYGWKNVDASREKEKIASDIWELVSTALNG